MQHFFAHPLQPLLCLNLCLLTALFSSFTFIRYSNFSFFLRIAKSVLVDQWDHAFLVYSGDTRVFQFLQSIEGHKTVVLDVQPTAENPVSIAFKILDAAYQDSYGNHLRLEHVRLFETPNCWADAVRKSI